jgi:hypothetical protein
MYVMKLDRMVLGGAGMPVQRLTTLLAYCDHWLLLIGREASEAGAKRYGQPLSSRMVSNSSMVRYCLRYGTISCEIDVTVGP